MFQVLYLNVSVFSHEREIRGERNRRRIREEVSLAFLNRYSISLYNFDSNIQFSLSIFFSFYSFVFSVLSCFRLTLQNEALKISFLKIFIVLLFFFLFFSNFIHLPIHSYSAFSSFCSNTFAIE